MSDITKRVHAVMAERMTQLHRNKLVVEGGRSYIKARLWRAPNESDVSWKGDPELGTVGRVERSALVNDAGRVAQKINQYIFKETATRDGADEDFISNCTGDGESVHDFMQRVSLAVTYGGWCWCQVDRMPLGRDPVTGETIGETLADKAPVRWRLWGANDVPDWCVDDSGRIRWLIVRSHVYVNDDPRKTAQTVAVSTLYERREDGVYLTEECNPAIAGLEMRKDFKLEGLEAVPFVLVGRPDAKAWWFDDVEQIQAQIMNLDSLHNETLTENVYPQLVLPLSLVNSLEVKLKEQNVRNENMINMEREITLGRKAPIIESEEDKGIARYIAPGGDLKLLTDEGDRKRRMLFDVVGLSLFNRETRLVQTAESKSFDQLDTNATLGVRAILLQQTEARLVRLSGVFDPGFRAWEPKYRTSFDVVDVAALSAALVQAANIPDQTPTVKKLVAKSNLRIIKELSSGFATDEEFEAAMKEIDEHDFSVQNVLPNPFGEGEDYRQLTQDEADEEFDEAMSKRRGNGERE